eukprot:148835-Amphidinium_carterae.2
MATTWEEAVAGGSNLLDAADQILRSSWLINLPVHATRTMGLQPPAGLGMYGAGGPSSLVAAGRVPARSGGPPPPLVPAGERAFQQAIKEARGLMPSLPAEVPRDGEAVPRAGRERGADSALRLAIEQGGETASAAVQLAMLETLERLASGNGGDRRQKDARGDTLEELLFGSDDPGGTQDSAGKFGSGVRGVVGMQRISQSIDAEPDRWSTLFDLNVYRSLGSDLTGAPWSCHRYGMEKINFGKHGDLKKFWFLLSTLHALHRGGKIQLLGAKIAQFLKAVEVTVVMGGHWSVSWALTGVADPDPSSSVHGGLTTPLEVATAIAFVKDAKVLEEATKKASGGGWGSAADGGSQSSSGGNTSNRGQGGGRRGRGAGRGSPAGDVAAPQSG